MNYRISRAISRRVPSEFDAIPCGNCKQRIERDLDRLEQLFTGQHWRNNLDHVEATFDVSIDTDEETQEWHGDPEGTPASVDVRVDVQYTGYQRVDDHWNRIVNPRRTWRFEWTQECSSNRDDSQGDLDLLDLLDFMEASRPTAEPVRPLPPIPVP